MTKFNPLQYHWPHFYGQKNNSCCAILDRELSDKMRDGKRYKRQLVCVEDGEVISEVNLGTFRRFTYNEYTEEAKEQFKIWAKEYENERQEREERK